MEGNTNHPILRFCISFHIVVVSGDKDSATGRLTVASAGPWITNHTWKKMCLKGTWLGRVNHLNFGGHPPYLWNGWSSQVLSTWVDSQYGKLVTVSVTSLSHRLSKSVYNTVGIRHRVLRVCQQQRRLVNYLICLWCFYWEWSHWNFGDVFCIT